MKITITGTLLLCFLASSHAAVTTRIVGGSDAPEGKYKYQAYVTNGAYNYPCGAAIINKRYVITTASCLLDAKPSEVEVTVGTVNPKKGNGQIINAQAIITHPDFTHVNGILNDYPVNDVALIRLRKDIEFNDKVQPVKLPSENDQFEDNSAVDFTGWGQLQHGGAMPETLQQIKLSILNQDQCKQTYLETKLLQIEANMICTAGKRGEGVCVGDSGSPLVKDGVLVGLASFGSLCALGQPDVFTRITSHLDWIHESSD